MPSTVIALATPPVPSALAVIRMTGSLSHQVCLQLSGDRIAPGQIAYRVLKHEGEVLDDVVVSVWKAPASYTGEDMVEFSCHGNMLIVDRIIAACCAAGAEPAAPGEFTRRAYLNGKMDLTQAEAISELIHARSERALKAVRHFQQGAFGTRLGRLRESLLQILSHLEAYIDFPDEDISPETGQQMLNQSQAVQEQLVAYLKSAQTGKFLRNGATIVLAGVPNAGKSSLMNALLEEERVLVSDQPGTTRDTVDAEFQIGGFPCFLTDTAGLRESHETIEQMGIERTRQSLRQADVILHLIDGSQANPDQVMHFPETEIPVIRIITKSDLKLCPGLDGLPVSSTEGSGLEALKCEILNVLKLNDQTDMSDSLAINARHTFHLQQAQQHMERALENLQADEVPEICSSDLRAALFSLAEIVGETSNEDILDRLFQNFCIGK
ncbi:MAG: tRNA uridine-5-carboxymethylaminomethyl(34) synthesis GTPase MnmE [Verrucomicrobiota bacterium]